MAWSEGAAGRALAAYHLSAAHAGALFIGTYSTFDGSTSQDAVPLVASLFGFIYFESIVFALGTSLFIYALVKERKEATGRMAALVDPLTGIANRAGFLENAERVLERSGAVVHRCRSRCSISIALKESMTDTATRLAMP